MVNGTSRCGLKPWYPIAFDGKSLVMLLLVYS
jgi:hypothetical protein